MLGENIKLAFASIAANKLRSFLTMLGIIIGIAAVIAIMTVGNSQTEQVREQYASFGTNNVDVYMWLADEINMDDRHVAHTVFTFHVENLVRFRSYFYFTPFSGPGQYCFFPEYRIQCGKPPNT